MTIIKPAETRAAPSPIGRPPWQTLPWRWYSDPAVARVETARLFSSSWQYFASDERLQAPGDFLAGEHGRVPVVVVRDAEGRLRGHLNVCRHRGTRVCVGSGN